MKIIDRYIYKEFFPPFLTGTLLFTIMFLLQRLEKLAELAFEKNVPPSTVIELLFYAIPFTAAITIPMGTLFGALFSLGRLSEDSEIAVLRLSGVSLYRILRPIFILGILITSFLFYFMNYVMTETNLRYKSIYINILYSNPGVVMTPMDFTSFGNGNQKITASQIEKGGVLRHIYLYDVDANNKHMKVIYAQEGRWDNNDFNSSQLSLKLFDGEVIQFNRSGGDVIDRIKFEKIVVNVFNDIRNIGIASEGLREMNFLEVRNLIQSQLDSQQPVHPHTYVEYHRKFSIPLACLAFVIISIPLAIKARYRSKGGGLGVSLIVVFAYYFLMVSSEALGKKETIDPQWALHIPNIIFGVIAMFLLITNSRK